MVPEPHADYVPHPVNTPHQFSYENGILLTRLEPGYAKGELTFGPNLINPMGNVHGGALATLADVVAGCCACSKGGRCVTANSSMEFLRPANTPKLYCEATPKKNGQKPVRHPVHHHQRPGCGGGHGNLHIFHVFRVKPRLLPLFSQNALTLLQGRDRILALPTK